MCPYAKRIYIIPSHSSVLKLQNYSSQYSSCPFFRKIKEKLFLVIGAINEASATNSVMNLSHILFAIADAKVLCYILYSSGNIQIKNTVGVQWTNPFLLLFIFTFPFTIFTYTLVTTTFRG